MFDGDAAGHRLPSEAPPKRRQPEGGGRSGEEKEGSDVEDRLKSGEEAGNGRQDGTKNKSVGARGTVGE